MKDQFPALKKSFRSSIEQGLTQQLRAMVLASKNVIFRNEFSDNYARIAI
ncbi:hypothetical protein [Acinetobacter sp. ANC 3789]|nr:hypothetical protein [Acinetobacter sp. ANC 3789]